MMIWEFFLTSSHVDRIPRVHFQLLLKHEMISIAVPAYTVAIWQLVLVSPTCIECILAVHLAWIFLAFG